MQELTKASSTDTRVTLDSVLYHMASTLFGTSDML